MRAGIYRSTPKSAREATAPADSSSTRCGSVAEALAGSQCLLVKPHDLGLRTQRASRRRENPPRQNAAAKHRSDEFHAHGLLSGWIDLRGARSLRLDPEEREGCDLLDGDGRSVCAYRRSEVERMPERNLVSWNSMVSGYAQAGMVAEAKKLFDQMPRRDLVSWTAMIMAFAKAGQGKNALTAFGLLDLEGFQADSVSFAATMDSCGDLRHGRLHADVLASSSAGSDVVVLTSLVAMYGRCASLEEARTTFDTMKNAGLIQSSVLPWNAMIVAYAETGRGQDAIRLFLAMDLDGVRANEFTFASVFDACSSCGAASLAHARVIHSTLVEESESLPSSSMDNVVVGTALVNMHGKFGCLEDSKRVFDAMTSRNVLSVTAMIEAYSQAGLSRTSLEVFRESTGVEGVEPDAVLFVSVLSVTEDCSPRAARSSCLYEMTMR